MECLGCRDIRRSLKDPSSWCGLTWTSKTQPSNQAAFALPELFVVVCELLRRFYLLKPAISILVLLGFSSAKTLTFRSCHYFGLLLMVKVFDWQGVPYKTTMPIFKDGYCLTAGSRCAVNWEMVQLLFVMPVISCFLKGCCGDCCCCCCSILYKGYTQQLFPVARWQSLDEPCIAHDILKHKG